MKPLFWETQNRTRAVELPRLAPRTCWRAALWARTPVSATLFSNASTLHRRHALGRNVGAETLGKEFVGLHSSYIRGIRAVRKGTMVHFRSAFQDSMLSREESCVCGIVLVLIGSCLVGSQPEGRFGRMLEATVAVSTDFGSGSRYGVLVVSHWVRGLRFRVECLRSVGFRTKGTRSKLKDVDELHIPSPGGPSSKVMDLQVPRTLLCDILGSLRCRICPLLCYLWLARNEGMDPHSSTGKTFL